MKEYTPEQIAALQAAAPETIYRLFVSRFPPGYGAQLDFLLLKGFSPEVIFELPSAARVPPVIKDVTLAALRWRKEQLILEARNN